MHNLDNLPELEYAHTQMSSTWDTLGGNADGTCFKNIQGNTNILLDVEGPGCIHRIFTGSAYQAYETRIQVFIDNNPEPIYDMDVPEFFDPHTGPFPYPLVFQKTYPGILFPIPYSEHIKIQLINEHPDKVNVWGYAWSNYWQVTYTSYPADDVKVKSLELPLSASEQEELGQLCRDWLVAESEPPAKPLNCEIERKLNIRAGSTGEIAYGGCGVIKDFRLSVEPNTSEVLLNTRMKIQWDGSGKSSVDVPLGYFFGNADYQNQEQYSSLLLGITESDVYAKFPMPFDKGFIISFENQSNEQIEKLAVSMDIEEMKTIPANFGRFHATWNEILIDSIAEKSYPRYGKSAKPFLDLLDVENCKGKYVGNLLHVAFPHLAWWGEGDLLIWSDETGFPPSYHGTGTEEYYNSGWNLFDRKAVSGYIKQQPANVYVYSFHLNDNFQFQKNLKASVEVWQNLPPHSELLRSIFGSTAFWYAYPVQDANSKQELIRPRLVHDLSTEKFSWE
ncbi:MAG: glycoside hydrolase family 172 protein [Mangrovibacterium sp.]